MKKTKNFFNLKNLKITFGILFISSVHISTISISRNPVKKIETEVDGNFLKIENFEISGINRHGKINVRGNIVKTLPNYIEFLYSINDSTNYIKTPPTNLSNGDKVNIKIFIKNDTDGINYKFKEDFVNKITVIVSGLPDSKIEINRITRKGKRIVFKISNLIFEDWEIFQEEHTIRNTDGHYKNYNHLNSNIETFVVSEFANGFWVEFILKISGDESNIWIKFRNKKNNTIYNFVHSNTRINFIDIADLVFRDLANSHPPTTKTSWDAIHAFRIDRSDILEKIDISIAKGLEKSKQIYEKIDLIKLEDNENIYVIPKKYRLKGSTKYDLKFSIKSKFKNTFFLNNSEKNIFLWKSGESRRELVYCFQTKWQREEGVEKPTILKDEHILPKTRTSNDGEYKFTLRDFYKDSMKVELVDAKKLAISKTGNKWIVKNLRSKEKFKIKISFKNKYLDRYDYKKGWKRSATPHYFILDETKTKMELQNIRGIQKPRFNPIYSKKIQQPSTKNSSDGKLEFRLRSYRTDKLRFQISSRLDGREWDVAYEKNGDQIVIKNLQSKEEIYISFEIIGNNDYWTDGKRDHQKRSLASIPLVRTSGIEKPIIKFKNGSEVLAHTKTSTDGEMTFTIERFDESTMNIRSSIGNISKIASTSNLWKVTNLQSKDKVEISINLKHGHFWNTKSDLREEITFEKTATEIFYEGIERVEILEDINPTNRVIPSTFSSKDGELGLKIKLNERFLNQGKILEFFRNVDYEIISLNSNKETTLEKDSFKIINLMNLQETKIFLKPKDGQYWKDGKKESIEFTLNAPTLNALAINQQPSIEDMVVSEHPSSGTSADGIIRIYLNNFDSNKMVLFSDVGKIQLYDRGSNQQYISKIQSNQEIKITIKPKSGYAWNSGSDVEKIFKMDKILDFPEGSRNIQINKEDPSIIGGNGYINIEEFVPIKYDGETLETAFLEYQENGIGEWKRVPYSGKRITGKNGFLVKFRWKLEDGYLWSKNSVIKKPQDVILKNPGAASVPRINIVIRNIIKPKGKGNVLVNSFDANGASLRYRLDDETEWHNVPFSGKEWEGESGFKIHFKWVLNEDFVWDERQPQKIINSPAELIDPIDLKPPRWKIKESISSDDFKIIEKSPGKYEANLKYYYGEKIPIKDILDLFEAMDRYGIYSHKEEKNIFSAASEIDVIQNNRNAIILSAIDLAGNRSELSINVLIKYKVEDLSNAKAHKVYFGNNFSGSGEITTDSRNIPKLIFKEHESNKMFNVNNKNIYAIYKVVDKNEKEVQWFTNQNEEVSGWSEPDKGSLNSFGQRYPKATSNDQIIQIKFLPKDGYKIKDYASKQEALLREKEPQFVSSSRVFEFKVEGLTEILEQSKQEPEFLFIGNDGQGKVELKPKSGSNVFENKAKYFLQVFRPYFPKNLDKNKEIVDNLGNPIYGFEIYIPSKSGNMNNHDNWHLVSGVSEDFSNNDLEIEEVRKLWRNTRLSSKVNNVSNMTNTLISADKINKLSNFYFLRTIEKAKGSRGYKHGSSSEVNLYPEQFTKEIIWDRKDGDLYFGIKVEKLSINPVVNILEKTFSIDIRPSPRNSYTYEGDMQIILSYYPNRKNGDKFIWRYKILDKEDNIISDWSNDFDTKNIKNGYKLIVGYQALPSFTLSSKFENMQRVFVIDKLKAKIDISTVPRPKIVFSGNVNQGTIKNLLEHDVGSKQPYDRSKKFPLPKTKHLESLKLKWQYRIFNSDPTKLIGKSPDALDRFTWIDDLPQKLNNNQYIQIRVAPKNSEKYGVEPQVYSIDPKIDSPFVRVNGLEINWKLLQDISFEIKGDKSQNILKMLGNDKQKDFQVNLDALIFEVKTESSEIWRPISHLNNKLRNGMVLSFRSYAKNPYLSHLPDPDLNEEIKLINKKRYLELPSWKKMAINGLKNTIRFKHISIKKPKLIAMKNTPWEGIKKGLSKLVIPSGWAKIEEHVVDLEDLKSAYYEDENGIIKNASQHVEVQYQLLEYDIRENKLVSQGWSTIIPTNLKNNDQIQIRVEPKDPKKFQLDWKRELIFKVENLYEDNKIIKIKAPIMMFSGINGQGIAMPAISNIDIYIYSYQIYDEDSKLIKDWSKDLPSKLKNGYYIKSRITESKDDIVNPKHAFDESELQKVYGLFAEFSLQGVDTKMFLEMEIVGRINHKASLHINNQIVKNLKDINYKVEYIVFNDENKKGKRFLDAPNNLSNGDKIEIEIINKKTGTSQNLKIIEKEFKGINVENLVDNERHTKTMSKSILIPIIIITSLLMVVTPIYLARRKRKLSV